MKIAKTTKITKISNSPSFKAKTTIHSHNILSAKQMESLSELGESIGSNEDSIYFNVRNVKKNKIAISHEAKLIKGEFEITAKAFVVNYKWLIKPEKYIKNIMRLIKLFLKKS